MTFNWKGKKILIAEDEVANFLFIEKVLDITNVSIIRANNGHEAISLVKENNDIDLILMDIHMPELDGCEASKTIKSLFPNIPVIAQTCYDHFDEVKFKLANFDDFVRKPINITKLLAIIDKHIVNPSVSEANDIVI